MERGEIDALVKLDVTQLREVGDVNLVYSGAVELQRLEWAEGVMMDPCFELTTAAQVERLEFAQLSDGLKRGETLTPAQVEVDEVRPRAQHLYVAKRLTVADRQRLEPREREEGL